MLMRMAVQGSAKVRASTWIDSAQVMAVQIQGPVTPAGGAVQLGTRLRKGASVYVSGKKARKMRKHLVVPRLWDSLG